MRWVCNRACERGRAGVCVRVVTTWLCVCRMPAPSNGGKLTRKYNAVRHTMPVQGERHVHARLAAKVAARNTPKFMQQPEKALDNLLMHKIEELEHKMVQHNAKIEQQIDMELEQIDMELWRQHIDLQEVIMQRMKLFTLSDEDLAKKKVLTKIADKNNLAIESYQLLAIKQMEIDTNTATDTDTDTDTDHIEVDLDIDIEEADIIEEFLKMWCGKHD